MNLNHNSFIPITDLLFSVTACSFAQRQFATNTVLFLNKNTHTQNFRF